MKFALDPEELVVGAATTSLGLALLTHAIITYPLGTLAQMGPGMFIAIIGGMLAVLGVPIAMNGRDPEVSVEPIPRRATICIFISIASVGIAVPMLGLVPASMIFAIFTVYASHHMSAGIRWGMVGVAAALFLAAFLLVSPVSLPVFRWPWN